MEPGTLLKTYTVQCHNCYTTRTIETSRRTSAEWRLRQLGWGTRKGHWHCRHCKDAKPE